MTLILALACSDGIVIAADSQATFRGTTQPLRLPEQKLWQIRDTAVVFGISGQVGMAQTIKQELERIASGVLRGPIRVSRPILHKHVCDVLREAHERHVPIDPQRGGSPIADTVIVGYAEGTPWILEISRNGLAEQHEHRGFLALGSGEAFAHFACAAMQHHAVRELGIGAAQVLAQRTIATAIEVAGFGLGPPVQMWVIDANGARQMGEDELEAISDTADLGKEVEREFLAEAMVQAGEDERAEEPEIDSL